MPANLGKRPDLDKLPLEVVCALLVLAEIAGLLLIAKTTGAW